MNQRAIIYILLALIGIPVLIQIGSWSATDPLYAGVSAILLIGIVVLTQLGTKCWLLIPFFASFEGAMHLVPGGFAPRDIAVGVVAVFLPAIWVVRRFPIRFNFGGMELGLAVILAFILQAYLRNPAGLLLFGSGVIGARPYFEIAVSVVAFFLLAVQVVDLKSVRMMVFANFTGSMVTAVFETVLGIFPGLAPYTASFYQSDLTGVALMQNAGQGSDPSQGAGRISYLSKFSRPIMNLLLAYRTPLEFLNPRNVGFLILAVFASICMLLSGYRSGVAYLGLMGIAAFLLHRKPMQLAVSGLVGFPILAVLLVGQGALFQLPVPAQRALSFLPADWDRRAVVSAEGSSEWRFLMWREALTSDRYIRNKWLGDGFGFTAQELAYQQQLMVRGVQATDQQDYYLAVGSYHSGPIETIKRVGYFGLAVLLIVMCVFCVKAVGLVNATRGSPYYPFAVFVALPIVVLPIMFVFIFGAFQPAVTQLLLAGGMMRVIGNSFDIWRKNYRAARAAKAEGAATGTPALAVGRSA